MCVWVCGCAPRTCEWRTNEDPPSRHRRVRFRNQDPQVLVTTSLAAPATEPLCVYVTLMGCHVHVMYAM